MHGDGVGETNRFTDSSLDAGSHCQVFSLNSLGIGFANCVLLWVNMALIRSPTIGIRVANPKRFQQRFELFEGRILVRGEYIRE